MDNEYTVIGKPRPIGDAALKVTGQKIYVGDMELPGMLYAKVLLSTVPHLSLIHILPGAGSGGGRPERGHHRGRGLRPVSYTHLDVYKRQEKEF